MFQFLLYRVGPEVAVTSDPRFTPSIWNWTPETATLSVEEAERVIVEDTTEPEEGETRVTEGGVRSSFAELNAMIISGKAAVLFMLNVALVEPAVVWTRWDRRKVVISTKVLRSIENGVKFEMVVLAATLNPYRTRSPFLVVVMDSPVQEVLQ